MPEDEDDAITGVESIVTIGYSFTRNSKKFRSPCVNINVLGSQKLSVLKDVLPCDYGMQPIGDFTNNPDLPKTTICQDIAKSGFFFIENTFYNDFRDPNNIDMSRFDLFLVTSTKYSINSV